MNNQDIIKQLNRKRIPSWVYIAAAAVIVLAVVLVFVLGKDSSGTQANQSGNDVSIDTSLIGEGEEDPENLESDSEDGSIVDYEELIIGEERVNAIDVSKWQGKIDWQKVKESGIEVAFIRIGYRGENGTIYKDDSADYNIQQAQKAGVLVGVYFFSTATNADEAIEEANWTKAAIKGEMYHLWWHPHNFGANIDENFYNLEQILKHFNYCRNKYKMQSFTMSELSTLVKENYKN